MKGVADVEWVALTTCVEHTDSPDAMFWEHGGIYRQKPTNPAFEVARPLVAGEHEALCPRCGQRFAALAKSTAEENRDLHFDGDDPIPSICRHLPTKRPVRIK